MGEYSRIWGWILALAFLGQITGNAIADVPIPLPFRSRPLKADQKKLIASIIDHEIQSYDPTLADELRERNERGLLRAMPVNAPFAQKWTLTAQTTKVLDKTVINEFFLSLEGFALFQSHACDVGTQWSCIIKKYGSNMETYRILFASVLIHEQVHVRQVRTWGHVGGTLSNLLSPIYVLATGENAWELEAFSLQDDFLLSKELDLKLRLYRDSKVDADPMQAKMWDQRRYSIYALRSLLRVTRTLYQKTQIIEQLIPFQKMTDWR